jgi:sRNA-binding regulator protein Hfq
MQRTFVVSLVTLFVLATLAVAGLEVVAPPEASAGGRYTGLLRVVPAPGDEATHGKFREAGYSHTPSWAGQDNLPAGYWVYVAPNWYIWQKQSVSKPAADDMAGKQVTVYLDNGTPVNGQLIENTSEHVVLLVAAQAKKKLIYKAKITSIEWPAGDAAPLTPAPISPGVGTPGVGAPAIDPNSLKPSLFDGFVIPGDLKTNKW